MILASTFEPGMLILTLAGVSLIPLFAVMATSYLKLVVVLTLTRNVLGIQQVPPAMVINGISVVLSLYIMAPVLENSRTILEDRVSGPGYSHEALPEALYAASKPFETFLLRHSDPQQRIFFIQASERIWPPEAHATITETSFFILLPSFALSELKTAFKIAFLIALPFLVVDMVVANILLAMGTMMLSPTIISLPFKLLLFVLVDGWTKLIHALILSYSYV